MKNKELIQEIKQAIPNATDITFGRRIDPKGKGRWEIAVTCRNTEVKYGIFSIPLDWECYGPLTNHGSITWEYYQAGKVEVFTGHIKLT